MLHLICTQMFRSAEQQTKEFQDSIAQLFQGDEMKEDISKALCYRML